jgi:hypothetical protein
VVFACPMIVHRSMDWNLATIVQWIACESRSLTGDPEGENESEGAGGGSEEVQEYAIERVRSPFGSLLRRDIP